MAYQYFKKAGNATFYRSSDRQAVDLPTFQKETGQTGLSSEQTKFEGYFEELDDPTFNSRISGVSSSDVIRKQEEQKKLDESKFALDQEAKIMELDRQVRRKTLEDALSGSPAPTKPDLAGDYTKTRDQYGLTSLEGELNDLDKQIMDKEAEAREGAAELRNRPILGVVASSQEREFLRGKQEELDALNRRRA